MLHSQTQTVIEEALFDVLKDTDLLAFKYKFAVEKQLTRLEHFDDSYGLSTPAIRRLRNAIEKQKKLSKKSKFFRGKRERLIPVIFDTEHEHNLSIMDISKSPCLIAREELKLMELLGEGTFAVVKRAIWKQTEHKKIECAVKILRDVSEQVKQELHAEITNMHKLSHQNLVSLHGVVFGEPTLMVIEYCENGALIDRLRASDKEKFLVTQLLKYAVQISVGMAYLESKRCPPESLRFRQFSHKSDVWAFGVTLWELFSYGEEPWIGYKAAEVLKLTESGERLAKPLYCSNEIFSIMNMCWNLCAESRPKFGHLHSLLHDVKFSIWTLVSRDSTSINNKDYLSVETGERIILISEKYYKCIFLKHFFRDNERWFGQSFQNKKFGLFLRNCVSPERMSSFSSNKPHMGIAYSLNNYNQIRDISYPIAGYIIIIII